MTTGGPADQHGNGYPRSVTSLTRITGNRTDGYQRGFQGAAIPVGAIRRRNGHPGRRQVVLVAAAAGVLLVVGGILARGPCSFPSGDGTIRHDSGTVSPPTRPRRRRNSQSTATGRRRPVTLARRPDHDGHRSPVADRSAPTGGVSSTDRAAMPRTIRSPSCPAALG